MTNDEYGQSGIAEDSGSFEESKGTYADYFSTPARQGLIQQLLHLVRFGDGIPVVQGSGRSGKSALARELASQLVEVPHLALVEVKSNARLSDVLVQALQQYGFEVEGSASEGSTTEGELLAELRRFSQALANDKKLGVLILDNAHYLDEQCLGALVSLLQGTEVSGSGLHLVFFAQPDLVSRIDELGLLDVSVYDFDVPLMSPSELSDFLKKHLEFRGNAGAKLSAETVQSIWSRSHGAPGYSLRLMWEAARPSSAKSALLLKVPLLKTLPVGHVVALSVLALVLVWALLLRDNDLESERIISEVALAPPGAGESPMASDNAQPDSGREFQAAGFQSQVPDNEAPDSELRDKEPDKKEVAIIDATPPKMVKLEGQSAAVGSESAATMPDSAKNKETIGSGEGDSAEGGELTRPEQQKSPADTASAPPVSVAALADTARPNNRHIADEKFLLDQNPASYTLQIMAASKKTALEDFIADQANRDSLFLYQGQRGGKAWFIVIAGIYPSREAAVEAIGRLPERQKKGGPWPRQLRNIQQDIAAN